MNRKHERETRDEKVDEDTKPSENGLRIVLDSYKEGKIIPDVVEDVFRTGEQELFEVELDNGSKIKCTLEHKFYCSDGKPHTVKEIMENDLEILYEGE